jgi:hypothetical protein
MKKENFDISKLPDSGYVVLPLSISRLFTGQSPEVIYEFLKFFEQKVESISNDVVLLYTDGLYLNNEDRALDLRKKMLNQMLDHKEKLLKLIYKEKKFVPKAFHFMTFDNAIINGEGYNEARAKLTSEYSTNDNFKKSVLSDLKKYGREEADTNVSFLIEEVVVDHLLKQKAIPFPHTLTNPNGWRLICYPGDPLNSSVFVYKHKLLPRRNDVDKNHLLFARSLYNMDTQVLMDFDVLIAQEQVS